MKHTLINEQRSWIFYFFLKKALYLHTILTVDNGSYSIRVTEIYIRTKHHNIQHKQILEHSSNYHHHYTSTKKFSYYCLHKKSFKRRNKLTLKVTKNSSKNKQPTSRRKDHIFMQQRTN